MAAGGYVTHRELQNGGCGVFNGCRYPGEIGQNVVMGPRFGNDTKRAGIFFRRFAGLEGRHLLGKIRFKIYVAPRGIPERVVMVSPIMGAGIR